MSKLLRSVAGLLLLGLCFFASTADAQDCDISPPELVFGILEIGQADTLEFVVRNEGRGLLEGRTSLDCDDFSLVDGEQDFALLEGEAMAVRVRFAPQSTGLKFCLVDLDQPLCGSVGARGSGVLAPECLVTPTQLDYGYVEVGETEPLALLVQNTGGSLLTGTLSTDCSDLNIVGDPTYSLGGGEGRVFVIEFNPQSEFDLNCQIETGSDLCPDVTVQGTSVFAPICGVPEQISFGPVYLGEETGRTLTIRNTGTAVLDGQLGLSGCPDMRFEPEDGIYSVSPGDSASFQIFYAPSTEGPTQCLLETGSDSCSDITLTGDGVGQPICVVEPDTLVFGAVPLGVDSTRVFVLSNVGTGSLSGTFDAGCGDFDVLGDLTFDVPAGEADSFLVRFSPTAPGPVSCSIGSTTDCAVVVTGNAFEPAQCEVTPDLLDFGEVAVGSQRDLSFTIRNLGGALLEGTLSLNCPEFFFLQSDLGYSLGPDEETSFDLRFAPTGSDPASCVIDLGSETCVDLVAQGSGFLPPACRVEPAELQFGPVLLGTEASAEVRIFNDGEGILAGNWIEDCDEFRIEAEAFAFSLGAGQSDTIVVVFAPDQTGIFDCLIASGTDCDVSVQGIGDPPPACVVTPSSLDFGDVQVGEAASLQFNVRNEGGGRLTGLVSEVCSAFQIAEASPDFDLGAGEEKLFTVLFQPQSATEQICTIDLGNSDCAELEARGVGTAVPECDVFPATLSFGEVEVGESRTRSFRVSNTGGGRLDGTVSTDCPELTVSGAASYDLGPGESINIEILYTPTEEGVLDCLVFPGAGCSALSTEGSATEDPACVVDASSLDFGSVLVGEEVQAAFTVSNEGGGLLQVEPSLSCDGFLLLGEAQAELGAGESAEFTVLFFPQEVTDYMCEIVLGTDVCESVNASGTGTAPGDCEVDAVTLDFGEVEWGVTPELSVTLTNTGGSTLEGSIEPGCGPFALQGMPGYELPGGESVTFTFSFAPEEPGPYTCAVGLGSGCGSLTLSGELLPPPQPECQVSAEIVDFGTARKGEPIRSGFVLRNVGAAQLQGEIVLDGCDYFQLLGSDVFDLGADESRLVEFEFQSELPGDYICNVDLGVLCSSVQLLATTSDAVLCQVTPSRLEFGVVEIGQVVDQIVTLQNLSPNVLEGSLQLPDCIGFFGIGPSAYSLLPGESRQFTIRMEPSVEGLQQCVATFGDGECGTVDLSGEAVRAPECAIEPTSLDFGDVEVGATARRTLTVANTGGSTLSGALQLGCPDFQLIGDSAFQLSAGESAQLTVEFVPSVAGSQFCDLDFGSELCRVVSTTGRGVDPPSPECEAQPSVLDFGGVIVGESTELDFVLRNVGTGELRGMLQSSCPDFGFDGESDVNLEPGESRKVRVVFQPQSTGPIQCRIEVGDSECLSVSARGRGEPAPEPICQLSGRDIDFGVVPIGLSAERVVTVKNAGGGRLEGTLDLEDCPEFQIVGSTSYSLGAREEQDFPIRFLPQTPTEVFCTINVGERCAPVLLTGRGGSSNDARCLVTPSVVDFGSVEVGFVAEQQITVRNDGNGVLVGELRPDCAEVEVVGNAAFRLDGGAELSWTLRYQPNRLGELDCALSFGDGLCSDVDLLGAGVDARPPLCAIEQDEVDFGLVAIGERVTRRVNLRNAGGGVLQGRLELCAPYSIAFGTADFALGPNQSMEWELAVLPTQAGEGICPLNVAGCDVLLRTKVIDPEPSLQVVAGRNHLIGAGVVTSDSAEFLDALRSEGSAQILSWSTVENRYAEPQAIAIDQGVWVQSSVAYEARWSGQGLASLHEIELPAGEAVRWHQIANPFQTSIPVAALSVRTEAGVRPFLTGLEPGLETAVWGWNGTALEPVSSLQPFQGYFVATQSTDDAAGVQLLIDPEADPFSVDDLPPLPLWQVRAQARQIDRSSTQLRMGALSQNDESLDRHAPPVPASVGLNLGILGADGAYAYRYMADEDVLVWDLTLTALDPTESVEIDFTGSIPADARAFVTQWERRRTEPVSIPSAVRLQPIGENMSLRFVVTKTDSIPDEIPPLELRLNEPVATPNPFVFETDLSMALEVEGTVGIGIYDPTGRRVRDFAVPASNGAVRATWDGRDTSGESVPAGVYLARFRVGSLERTLRLVVMN